MYLRADVQVEPLVASWYAWPHLISPATAALNISRRNVEIMESFVDAPDFHEAAVKDQALIGGPFVDHPRSRVGEIQRLLAETLEICQPQIEFADAIQQLNAHLQRAANGDSLEGVYQGVPRSLKGLVELVYDANHQASVNYIEPLLYRSSAYSESLQSVRLSLTDRDDRKFALSTPRLPDPDAISLAIPFRSKALDLLFRARTRDSSVEELMLDLNVADEQRALFGRCFTSDVPRPGHEPQASGLSIRYFGHACVLVEFEGTSILVDPVISYDYPSSIDRFTFTDLPAQIDYVLITHNHQDHVLLESLLQIRHKVRHLVVPRNASGMLQDPSLKLMFSHLGFESIVELDALDAIPIGDGAILGVPSFGEHSDLRVNSKLGYVVELAGQRIYFAADARNFDPDIFVPTARHIGHVDVLFLGMETVGAPLSWLYGPLLTRQLPRDKDRRRALNGSDADMALNLVRLFAPRQVYVYAMGQEPWLRYIMSLVYSEASPQILESNKLIAACHAMGLVAERLFGKKEILVSNASR